MKFRRLFLSWARVVGLLRRLRVRASATFMMEPLGYCSVKSMNTALPQKKLLNREGCERDTMLRSIIQGSAYGRWRLQLRSTKLAHLRASRANGGFLT